MATFRELITRTQTRLRMAGGVDVQVYADPVIAEMINYIFKQMFERRFWSFNRNEEVFQIGTNGLVNVDISMKIKRFSDINYVFLESSPGAYIANTRGLPKVPNNINPSAVQLPSIRPYNDPTKVFQVLPVTTTGYLRTIYRTFPDPFIDDSEVPMDDQLIILHAAYEFLSDEGTNTVAVKRLEAQAKARLETLEKLEMDDDMSLHSYTAGSLNTWRDADA